MNYSEPQLESTKEIEIGEYSYRRGYVQGYITALRDIRENRGSLHELAFFCLRFLHDKWRVGKTRKVKIFPPEVEYLENPAHYKYWKAKKLDPHFSEDHW